MDYRVTARAARIPSGVLVLTEDQARRRRHALRDMGGGRYEIATPVEFKAGEVIGYEGDLPKSLAAVLADPVVQVAVQTVQDKKPRGRTKKTSEATA